MKTVHVEPSGDLWVVSGDGLSSQLVFAKGSEAETAARQLALAFASGDEPVSLSLRLRTGGVCRFLCLPPADPLAARFVQTPPGVGATPSQSQARA